MNVSDIDPADTEFVEAWKAAEVAVEALCAAEARLQAFPEWL